MTPKRNKNINTRPITEMIPEPIKPYLYTSFLLFLPNKTKNTPAHTTASNVTIVAHNINGDVVVTINNINKSTFLKLYYKIILPLGTIIVNNNNVQKRRINKRLLRYL